MPNTKAAEKALRVSTRKNAINVARKSRIKTFGRKVTDAIKAGNKTLAVETMKEYESEIMKGVSKKILKLNTASRKISKIAASINKLA